jgi:frataxin-like iron-binding protein CyaY
VEPGKYAISKKINTLKMKNYYTRITGILFLVIACTSFTYMNNKQEPAKGIWVPLFDGSSLRGWHGFNKTGTIQNWTIEDGAMVCLGAAADAHGGDIVTNEAYENFELKWDWKISKGGNSGVMYHVLEGSKYQAPYQTGPEYQLIDDIDFPEKLEEWQKTGADYAMNLTNDKKKLKPVGEWNTSKIIFNKGHVEHWLNGKKIVEFQAWDTEWTKKKTEGKWKDFPDYGSAKKGVIALQDHGNKAYFKNILIKVL